MPDTTPHYNRTDMFTLFWSTAPQGEQPWSNLGSSGVRQVMLPLDMAVKETAVIARLTDLQKRVVLRVTQQQFDNDTPTHIKDQVRDVAHRIATVAVIMGVEPDGAFNLEFGSPTWGNTRLSADQQSWIERHRDRVASLREELAAIEGLAVISPGWVSPPPTEDEPPLPGQATWAEITRIPYDLCDGNGAHIYQDAGGWVDLALRIKFMFKRAMELHHKPLWVDELGVYSAPSQVARMRAYCEVSQWLELPNTYAGSRVMMLCPFVSTGNPYDEHGNQQWPPQLLITDPAAYALLGEYMRTGKLPNP